MDVTVTVEVVVLIGKNNAKGLFISCKRATGGHQAGLDVLGAVGTLPIMCRLVFPLQEDVDLKVGESATIHC